MPLRVHLLIPGEKLIMFCRSNLKHPMLLAALGLAFVMPSAQAEPWTFGVMADTQWTTNDAANNPGTVALGIMNQILPEFVNKKVKFVVQLGDLTDNGSTAGLDVWSTAAGQLYSAGIGFYPVRGNHEPSSTAATRFKTNFPQTQGLGSNVAGATGHRSPTTPVGLIGLTYAFEYNNVTFVAIDQFTRSSGTTPSTNSAVLDQVEWLKSTLETKPTSNHAFLFAHKPIIGQNHVDNLLGANPSSNPTYRDTLIKAMAANNARYFLSGHDHLFNRAIIKSPDGTASIQNIIHSSDSYKFYIPRIPSADQTYNASNRQETPISQELFTVGYYIVTVDGPRMTFTHYASDNGCGGSLGAGKDCDLKATPSLTFFKRETYGYSLNGKEFVIQPGAGFLGVTDTSPTGSGWVGGTRFAILGGTNAASTTLYDGRVTVQDINTGWTSRAEADATGALALKSDKLTLWGMHNAIGSEQGDTYTLSLSYEDTRGPLAVKSTDDNGALVHSADRNFGGAKKFIVGPWKAAYGLGTYGIDPATKTAWAVVNHGGEFVVTQSADGDLNGDNVIDSRDIVLISQNLNAPASTLPAADVDGDGKITALDARKLALICTLPSCAVAN